jgi:putative addiction module component (TIGR02574 family)
MDKTDGAPFEYLSFYWFDSVADAEVQSSTQPTPCAKLRAMASSKDVLAQALTLPLKQRARIAHELIVSLDEAPPEDPSEVAKAWDDEIVRRVEDLKAGRAAAVPWSAVKKDMDRAIRSLRTRKRRSRKSAR